MTALGAYLKADGNAFYFQIADETPELDNYFRLFDAYMAPNGWRVMKGIGPEIDVKNKIIYLRGSSTRLNKRVHRCWDLSSDWKAEKIVNEIDSALTALVKTIENFFHNGECQRSVRIAPMGGHYISTCTPYPVKKTRNGTFNNWKPTYRS
jgi:hypothetical protein